MTHICESKPDQCVICLKFERDKLSFRLKKAESCIKELENVKYPLFKGRLDALNKIEWQIVGHVELKAKFAEVEKRESHLSDLLMMARAWVSSDVRIASSVLTEKIDAALKGWK